MEAGRHVVRGDGAPHAGQRDAREPSLPVALSMLTPPTARPDSVMRTSLVGRVLHHDASVISVVAPAGYGKTTLALQWAERDVRPFAWLSLDKYDNDPMVLLTGIALALERIGAVDASVLRSLPTLRYASASALMRLLMALDRAREPAVLVLDDVFKLENVECRDMVTALMEHLPAGWQLALVTREAPWLPLARLRSMGRIAEYGREDLAMDDQEATVLLSAAGVTLDRSDIAALNRRTEGWPVALYLAALVIAAAPDRDRGADWPGGTDRFMVEYLQAEVLSLLSASTVEFLIRTSLPLQISGSLCDAMLDGRGSAARLESLARVNALVIPLDHERRWYRYHHLFRELLCEELQRRDAERVPVLRRRAADWYEANGLPDRAIDEAMSLGDAAAVARIAGESAQALYQRGRVSTVERWFDWLDERNLLERYPRIATTGALVHLLAGRAAAGERWIDAAERGAAAQGGGPNGDSLLEGELAMLRAVACRDGVIRMREDAGDATRLSRPGSRYRPVSLVLLGTAHLLTGDSELADAVLSEAVDAAQDGGATGSLLMAFAERALLAEHTGQISEWKDLAGRASAVIAEAGLDDYPLSALAYAIGGRVRLAHVDVAGAKVLLERAQDLRRHLTHALPIYAVQTRLELASGYLSLTDITHARTVLREAGDILRRRPQLGSLVGRLAGLQLQLTDLSANMAGASALTSAELRLLPLLATHLSFRKIGERLFISPNTVKTEAISIYRKLGVSSRGEAIASARELGLLPDDRTADPQFIRRG